MPRTRTTKKLAQRIDLNYFKRPSPYKSAKLWLSVLLPVLALGWIVWRSFIKDSRVYSSGRMSAAHAVLEKECSACHLQQAGVFSQKAADNACLACHDGPIHHATQVKTFECASCHTEHRGRINIAATSNQTCAECHSSLRTNAGPPHYAAQISSFEDGHPQFAAVRDGARDPATIKLNHAIHMKPIRRGPTGQLVQLECGDCHRGAAVTASWKYADAKYVAAKSTYGEQDETLPPVTGTLSPHAPDTGRELMAPVKFATACASCHALTFDRRFDEGVPHDKPEVVHAFLVKKFSDYIAKHPAELRETRDPNRDLTGKPAPPSTQALTPSQWVAQRTAVAEELLWHKTCAQCHTMSGSQLQDTSIARWSVGNANASPGSAMQAISNTALPHVAPTKVTVRWMPHAHFDHDAHRGFTCVSCHEKALSSTESTDVLLPGIATCQTCHNPGAAHAESRCYECHTYHDWSQRKEVTPKFTLPALLTGR
jgi:transcription elongation factor Elf1